MIASFLQDLRQPEYVHVLINPLPVYGLLVAIIGLAIALGQRSRRAQIATLVLILLCAASAWPVVHFGEAAYDRVLSLVNDQGQDWLKVHMHRADEFIWYFYALGLLAALAIFVPIKWPKTATALAVATFLYSLVVLAMGGYIGYAGGKIRHREFRNEPPPPVPLAEDQQ